MALDRLRKGRGGVAGLLSTMVAGPKRIAVHEVGAELIRLQAASLGLPLIEVPIPTTASNAAYEAALASGLARSLDDGVDTMAFGDLFLEDIRSYRDGLAARLGLRPLYPVWKEPTTAFARTVIAAGIKAIVCSVDPARLELSYAGRDYDATFLADLPPDVDPCGENGEFHTFVHDGPGFTTPVRVVRGKPEMRGWLGCCPLSAA